MFHPFKSSDRVFFCVSYCVFSLPLILFFAFFIPPFQVPDESSHFSRAYQLTHGDFFPTKQQVPDAPGEYTVGGYVDPAIFFVAGTYYYLEGHPDVKLKPKRAALAKTFKWQRGEMRDTRNVSIYPPTFYAVSALGIMLGQYFDMSIVESLTLSRLMNGLFALLLITIAILTLRKGFGVFIVLLLMPMTLSQIASTSQDAICFAAAALCVSMLSQLSLELSQRKRRIYLFLSGILLVTLATARPPYLTLSLLYLYYALTFRAQPHFLVECCVAFFATCLVTFFWLLYVAFFVSVPFGQEGVNPVQQSLFIVQSPLEWLEILAKTWQLRWEIYRNSFIGNVGHLDTQFPNPYYYFTGMALLLAFFMSFFSEKKSFFPTILENALIPCMIILVTIVGIFAVSYISFSPLHNSLVDGIQGRYFIPAALFVALGTSNSTLTGVSRVIYRCMILAFAVTTLIITPYVVLTRYS